MPRRSVVLAKVSICFLAALLVLLFTQTLAATAAHGKQKQPARSQDESPAVKTETTDSPEEEMQPGNVVVDGKNIVTVYQSIGSYSAQDRADLISKRIINVARSGVAAESISVSSRREWSEIMAENELLMVVTDGDAKAAGRNRMELANEYAGDIRQAVLNYRREHSVRAILRAVLYTTLATALLVLLVWLSIKIHHTLRRRVENWIVVQSRREHRSAWHLAVTYVSTVAVAIGAVLRWIFWIVAVQVYLTVTLGFFPATRAISNVVTAWLFSTLASMGTSALQYLPNLVVIIVIAFVAAQILRLISRIFGEIAKGNLQIRGFYPDWANPTAKLVRVLVLILVIVVVFPYLPGSKSPAFQGISIFVGVLLSLGSSSAVANGISGVILTYMRSFLVGDYVSISNVIGVVIEKNILVTRILTQKNEIMTIPNATVMGGSVLNFTAEAKHSGVIFHTTVTIGYDAPWRTVHQLLLEAACATKEILVDPKPFVLQTALNDFYVAYELNAYTDKPREMQFIYSELHQNIQDKFNEAGVEICSPHFSSLRDGNMIAIPEQYVRPNYKLPSFHVAQEEASKAAGAGQP